MDKNEIINLYSEYSSQFDEKIGSQEIYHKSYSDFILSAKKKKNLLDLACGPGNVSAFVKKMIPEMEIVCVDLVDEMLHLANEKIKDAKFYKSDILQINIPEKQYDLIVCAFGIPYIKSSEINTFVSEIDRFSGKGTSVYISCMEGKSITKERMSFADSKTISVQRHQKKDIVESFKSFNFKLTDFRTQDYKEPDESITKDMIFFFEKE